MRLNRHATHSTGRRFVLLSPRLCLARSACALLLRLSDSLYRFIIEATYSRIKIFDSAPLPLNETHSFSCRFVALLVVQEKGEASSKVITEKSCKYCCTSDAGSFLDENELLKVNIRGLL